ncbi:ATP-dependent (S)-NAD(P)H-hydrate dehydratase isoform X2 [Brachionus plicatilis]|uniref:ATP-dependent (S)-NAD(P)H-hydrate dehydratase n=1 Tax=Brachionus plicatilis TaxID=10195 RepID=A0A3M7T2L7_BRAPC|nr:ATP-dependent (S)-NAD(P)H-hydrate dehydratase isoform X2 [Brachionus plicatilis]
MPIKSNIIEKFRSWVPKMRADTYKGQGGRIGIIGGSHEYSGSAYISAMSSLKTGADLSYILTTREASSIIKTYSPDLVVLPILDDINYEIKIGKWMNKFHSVIIGPGLGRTEEARSYIKVALQISKAHQIPIVIDSDCLYLLAEDTSLIKGYKKCILTPNFKEFKRLYENAFANEEYNEISIFGTIESQCEAVRRLAENLGYLTILKKGKVDIISDGKTMVYNEVQGSLKRCGGIGDLMTGTLSLFFHWCNVSNVNFFEEIEKKSELEHPNIIAAYTASVFTRRCSQMAFDKYHRSVMAADIIAEISDSFYEMFDKDIYSF